MSGLPKVAAAGAVKAPLKRKRERCLCGRPPPLSSRRRRRRMRGTRMQGLTIDPARDAGAGRRTCVMRADQWKPTLSSRTRCSVLRLDRRNGCTADAGPRDDESPRAQLARGSGSAAQHFMLRCARNDTCAGKADAAAAAWCGGALAPHSSNEPMPSVIDFAALRLDCCGGESS
jgi:hypothetical protein